MHVLRYSSIEGLDSFINHACENKLTQGVVLDINAFWLTAYRLAHAGYDLKSNPDLLWSAFEQNILSDIDTGWAFDLDWRDDAAYDWITSLFGEKWCNPYLLKLIALPVTEKQDLESRQSLLELARQAPAGTVAIVETRFAANLTLAAGDRCQSLIGVPGTIGGFLRDQNSGAIFATTCGHVIMSGVAMANGVNIGRCLHAQAPRALSPGQNCSRGGPSIDKLDISLIDIGSSAVSNPMRSIATTVYPTDPISMTGASTGSNKYEVGGACMVYKISGYCFDNLFEVRTPAPGPGITSRALRASFSTVPAPGDSGAWIERTGTSDWCGVVVAADHAMGYALEADGVIVEANAAFGTNLVLV